MQDKKFAYHEISSEFDLFEHMKLRMCGECKEQNKCSKETENVAKCFDSILSLACEMQALSKVAAKNGAHSPV